VSFDTKVNVACHTAQMSVAGRQRLDKEPARILGSIVTCSVLELAPAIIPISECNGYNPSESFS